RATLKPTGFPGGGRGVLWRRFRPAKSSPMIRCQRAPSMESAMNTVLGVITDWSLADQVLSRARQLGKAHGARVCLYCPVTDQLEEMNRYIGFDNYQAVKDEILADNRARLEQLIGDLDIDAALDWQVHPYQGVAAQAESCSATLIV